jgi:hypothetical protein
MVGHRVRRGFQRLGLVVTVPAFCLALGATAFGGIGLMTAPEPLPFPACYTGFLADTPTEQHVRCRAEHERYNENYDTRQKPYELLTFAGMSAAIGALWFALCWAIGWVLAGFARDERPV